MNNTEQFKENERNFTNREMSVWIEIQNTSSNLDAFIERMLPYSLEKMLTRLALNDVLQQALKTIEKHGVTGE